MMHSTLDNRPFSPLMTSMRSQQDPYRSLPGTPLVEHRALTTMDMGSALNHARGLLQEDYFTGASRYAPSMRPRSPYPGIPEYEQEGQYVNGSLHGEISPDRLAYKICIHNMSASLLNRGTPGGAEYAKIQPHMCEDGRFPSDLQTPKTVQSMRVLDNTQLDRILLSYHLTTDHDALRRYGSREMTHSSTRVRMVRLHTLWEFLGAYKLLEYDKMKRGILC